ncbi:hypothetical protein Pcinc_003209 [Petrolisthes cinctipes]|uniref:Uncharacterized protein n=1 Tax=Petrolisthes cinctipes TaxID=88211 RepID=A0AAE1L1D1_PETCI|nr:hypothetical protein Pcinc_003209 [Petrolisthes cinctipes]
MGDVSAARLHLPTAGAAAAWATVAVGGVDSVNGIESRMKIVSHGPSGGPAATHDTYTHRHFTTLTSTGMDKKEVNERNVKLRANMLSVRGVVRLQSAKDPHCTSHTSLDISYTVIPYICCTSTNVNV